MTCLPFSQRFDFPVFYFVLGLFVVTVGVGKRVNWGCFYCWSVHIGAVNRKSHREGFETVAFWSKEVERVGGSCEEMKWFVMGVLVICKESYHIQLYDTWKHQKECSRVNLSKCDSSSLAMPTDPTCLYYVFFFFLDYSKKKKLRWDEEWD